MTDEESPSLYVPYSEDTESSVWVVDSNLQLFTSIPEETARYKAEQEQGHIFFFAELTTEVEAIRHNDYRDAITGQFVSQENAEANPDTTVHEES